MWQRLGGYRARYCPHGAGSEDAEFWGDLHFYSLTEEATFNTDYLYWDNDERKLTGKDESTLSIQRDSGTHIEGVGFEAEALTRSVTFSGPVRGMYITEGDEDAYSRE